VSLTPGALRKRYEASVTTKDEPSKGLLRVRHEYEASREVLPPFCSVSVSVPSALNRRCVRARAEGRARARGERLAQRHAHQVSGEGLEDGPTGIVGAEDEAKVIVQHGLFGQEAA